MKELDEKTQEERDAHAAAFLARAWFLSRRPELEPILDQLEILSRECPSCPHAKRLRAATARAARQAKRDKGKPTFQDWLNDEQSEA